MIAKTVIRSVAAAMVIGVLVAGGLLVTDRLVDAQKEDYYRYRVTQAETAAAMIDSSDVLALEGNESDLRKPAFLKIKSDLVRVKQSDPHLRFVYLMGPSDGNLVFLIDAENSSSPEYSPPGEVYVEATEEDLKLFESESTQPPEIEGPITDRWGTWISASAYIHDSEGAPIALLGTDADAATALSSVNETRRIGNIFTALVAVLFLLVALQYILWTYNKDKREATRRKMEDSILRLNRELQRADELKSEFIQLASHEFRSPVNAANVAVQTMKKHLMGELSDEGKRLVVVAADGTERLTDLVDNMFDLTRIEAGDFSFRPREVDVGEILSKTGELYGPVAEEKNLGFSLVLPRGGLDAVIDRQSLLRVLENLITNAIKFTDSGEIELSLQAKEDSLLFTVSDTGAGIPAGFEKEVFRKFTKFRREGDTRGGAGMGLALCEAIVARQGGRIWLESVEGEGTKVFFEIPRYQDASGPGDRRDSST